MTTAPPNSSRDHDARALASAVGASGWVSLGAIALLAIVLVWTLTPVVDAALRPDPGAAAASLDRQGEAERYAQSFQTHRDRFDGRSAFFLPPAPPPRRPPPRPRPEPEPEPEREPPPPPPPARYTGPDVLFVMGETVWFDNGENLSVGDDERFDVRVVGANVPWAVTLEYRGREFEVELFERTTDRFLEAPPASAPSDAEAENETENDTDPDTDQQEAGS